MDVAMPAPAFAELDNLTAGRKHGHLGSARSIGLGIDAGGTFTDSVLYDLAARRVLAKAKSLTTYQDLVIGIRNSLNQLPKDQLALVEVTSLSTTLATNAIVQDRGHKVGLIVLTPFDWFTDEIGHNPTIRVPGAVDITGDVVEPLDEDACRLAVNRLVAEEHCGAIVIGGYGSVHNPQQVNRAREIAVSVTDAPIVCAHEVSRRLNAVQGARTAIANARLLPVISRLTASVRSAMAELGLPERLMVVKGDGTPVSESVACLRPIETILSGPAASVSGARLLSGCDDALVMDIGGTTTDCAILANGLVTVAPAGARVGAWTMSVDVADINTAGLGGDSRIDFGRSGELSIGPIRNVPFSCAATQWPSVGRFLDKFDRGYCIGAADASAMDVLVRAGGDADEFELTDDERSIVRMLAAEPVPAIEAARRLGMASHKFLPISRLERFGLILRAGLTPTDLLHVSGRFERWNGRAARAALDIFAAMIHGDSKSVLNQLLSLFTRRLFDEVIRREMSHNDPLLHALPDAWGPLLDSSFSGEGSLHLKASLNHPIVAIGAPAQALATELEQHLGALVIVPEHADVANAVGAIGAEIVVSKEVVIAPDRQGSFHLYGEDGRFNFATLNDATAQAVTMLGECAIRHAREAGAFNSVLNVSMSDSTAKSANGATVFLERRVRARATGPAFAVAGRVSRSNAYDDSRKENEHERLSTTL
jgi:N-methylhydantoinase A/oxoprolinase/acetone carboxylase beta subunit